MLEMGDILCCNWENNQKGHNRCDRTSSSSSLSDNDAITEFIQLTWFVFVAAVPTCPQKWHCSCPVGDWIDKHRRSAAFTRGSSVWERSTGCQCPPFGYGRVNKSFEAGGPKWKTLLLVLNTRSTQLLCLVKCVLNAVGHLSTSMV